MKKVIITLLIVVALVLSGCGRSSRCEEENSDWGIIYWRDPETGVYYVRSGGYGICPRYNADGTLYTGGEE